MESTIFTMVDIILTYITLNGTPISSKCLFVEFEVIEQIFIITVIESSSLLISCKSFFVLLKGIMNISLAVIGRSISGIKINSRFKVFKSFFVLLKVRKYYSLTNVDRSILRTMLSGSLISVQCLCMFVSGIEDVTLIRVDRCILRTML